LVDYYEASALSIDTSLKQVCESTFFRARSLSRSPSLSLALALSLALSLALDISINVRNSRLPPCLRKAWTAVSDAAETPSLRRHRWLHPVTFRLLYNVYMLQCIYVTMYICYVCHTLSYKLYCLEHRHTLSLSHPHIPPPVSLPHTS